MKVSSPIETIIKSMTPGSWYEIPDTKMSKVFPPKEGHPAWGVEGAKSITSAWGGAAFDTLRNRLIVTGGGHRSYGGNEIYAFDLPSLSWFRLTNPSEMVPNGLPNYVTTDGSRVSSHTYDGLQYIPTLDALFLWGGSQYESGNNVDCAAYLFKFADNSWHRKSESPTPWVQPATAWDSKRGRVLCVYKTGLYGYDPHTDLWSNISSGWWFQGGCSATYSPDHDIFFRLSVESHVPKGYIEFKAGSSALKKAPLTGTVPVSRVGLVYHHPSKKFVVWDGDETVWTVDPISWEVVEHSPNEGPSSVDESGKAKNHGTYSKWQYSPDYDVFVALNSTSDNVWLYKLKTEDSMTTTPTDPKEPPTTPTEPKEPPELPDGPIIITNPGGINVGPSRTIKTLAEAAALAKEGDVFLLDNGEYNEGVSWPVGITLRGVGGRPKIGGTVVDNKGIFVTRGGNTLIENVVLHSALGGTSNAAAIRHEGKALVIKDTEITNCHNGMLVGHESDMTVEVYDTHFHHMWTRGDLAHNIYVGKIGELIVDGCHFEDGESGHFVKTLAAKSRIYYNRIIQTDDLNAAFIDIWGCQDFEIIGNVMKRGGRYGSLGFIQITPRGTVVCPDERVKRGLVAFNTVFFANDLHDDPRRTELVHYNYPAKDVRVINNIVVHCKDVVWDSKGYGFGENGGISEGNYHTQKWENDLFVDPTAGDLRLVSPIQTALSIDLVPDRQPAFPIGTVARTDGGSSVGAYGVSGSDPIPDPEPTPDPDPIPVPEVITLVPGSYNLSKGVYTFAVD